MAGRERHLVVVGGSLAGLRAVEAARRAGFAGGITLVSAEEHLPYDRPPLSKQFLTADELPAPPFFRDLDALREELQVDVRLGETATALDPAERTVCWARTLLRITAWYWRLAQHRAYCLGQSTLKVSTRCGRSRMPGGSARHSTAAPGRSSWAPALSAQRSRHLRASGGRA
jgi:hypothetical protein